MGLARALARTSATAAAAVAAAAAEAAAVTEEEEKAAGLEVETRLVLRACAVACACATVCWIVANAWAIGVSRARKQPFTNVPIAWRTTLVVGGWRFWLWYGGNNGEGEGGRKEGGWKGREGGERLAYVSKCYINTKQIILLLAPTPNSLRAITA